MYRKKRIKQRWRLQKQFSGKQYLWGILLWMLYILTAGIFIINTETILKQYASFSNLQITANETSEFRKMKLSEDSLEAFIAIKEEGNLDISELLVVLMTENDFNLNKWEYKDYSLEVFESSLSKMQLYREEAFKILKESYDAVWKDVEYFPVPVSTNDKREPVDYEDSWLFERNYGGKRAHEGADIMAGDNEREIYPIVSMTDGVVENIGWLEQGGYRIGIRSTHGGYFYYAHLASYEKEFEIGETIQAGQLLGYMGDTGYSTVEGTTGMFDVHLHLGIYIETEQYEELSVNPYWILRYIEDSILQYDY